MAKGRKLTTSRSELYLGSYGYNPGHGASNGSSELEEDEVWSMVDDSVNDDGQREWIPRAFSESDNGHGRYTSHRPPPLAENYQAGGLSFALDDSSNKSSSPRIVHQSRGRDNVAESPRGRHMAASAPVNVPDWSKIYRVESVESLNDWDDSFVEKDSEIVPPHEYVARSHRMYGNSVFEGVGRTLKGRDMSRVRDAVWSQTKFYG